MPPQFAVFLLLLLSSSTWLRRDTSLRQVEVAHRAAREVQPLATLLHLGDKVHHGPSGPRHVSCNLYESTCVISQRPAPRLQITQRPLMDGDRPQRGLESQQGAPLPISPFSRPPLGSRRCSDTCLVSELEGCWVPLATWHLINHHCPDNPRLPRSRTAAPGIPPVF